MSAPAMTTHTNDEMLALADEYDAGTIKATSSGYMEFDAAFVAKREMISDALRFHAAHLSTPQASRSASDGVLMVNVPAQEVRVCRDCGIDEPCDEDCPNHPGPGWERIPSSPHSGQISAAKAQWFCEWLEGFLTKVGGRDELDAFDANTIRNTLNECMSHQPSPGETASKWQPIETAPKDGTPIEACNTRHPSNAPVIVRWTEDGLSEDLPEPHWCDAATADGSALYYNQNYFDFWKATTALPSTERADG